MKLQGLSIVFILIIVPVVLVLSYYIQMQVDTIELQASYNAKLLDATHDAMSAFELNTSNEDLSSVSDSLRSIIEASNNVFMNTLATNLGMSNASSSYLEPYIPAMLYTLYDGYYIYAPTNVPDVLADSMGNVVVVEEMKNSYGTEVLSVPGLRYSGGYYYYNPEDSNTYSIGGIPDLDFGQILYRTGDDLGVNTRYTTNLNEAAFKTDYILKSYNPYTVRYQSGDIDIAVNYTLDNFINIKGKIGNIYYTKSGYLIKPSRIPRAVANDGVNPEIDLLSYNETDAENLIKTGNYTVEVPVNSSYNTGEGWAEILKSFAGNGSYDEMTERQRQLQEQLTGLENRRKNGENVDTDMDNTRIELQNVTSNIQKMDAVIYYVKAKIFSEWVYNNLGTLTPSNAQQTVLEDYDYVSTNLSDANANLATSAFITKFANDTEFIFNRNQDPETPDSKFESHKLAVIRNSIQYNLNLAMSNYNNSSAERFAFNMPVIQEDEWQQILNNVSVVTFMQGMRCGLKTYNNYAIVSSTNNELTVVPEEIYFIAKNEFNNEVSVYHKIDCPLSDGSIYDSDISNHGGEDDISFTSKEVKYDRIYNKNLSTFPYTYDHKNLACYICGVDGNYESSREYYGSANGHYDSYEYYTAIGAQRQELYKANAVLQNEGFETLSSGETTTRGVNEIKALEITFANTTGLGAAGSVVFQGSFNAGYITNKDFTLSKQSTPQTITFYVNSGSTAKIKYTDLLIDAKNQIQSIKVIYK